MSGEGNPASISPRSNWYRFSGWIGAAIGAAGAFFVVRLFIRDREQVMELASDGEPLLLTGAVLLGLAAMTGIGLAWRAALRILGSDVGLAVSLRGYFVGQLGKYVPGGVWAIMGRGEWARNAGVPRPAAYSSVVLSMGSAYLAALLVGIALLPFAESPTSTGGIPFQVVLLLLPLGFVVIHPRVVGWILDLVRRVSRRPLAVEVPSWSDSVRLVTRQIPSWLAIGGATYVVAIALGSAGDLANVITAAAVSWVVGFLALPVPGGLGVREAVFVAMATSLPAGIAATVALVARLVFVAVDGLGAGITTLIVTRRRQRAAS